MTRSIFFVGIASHVFFWWYISVFVTSPCDWSVARNGQTNISPGGFIFLASSHAAGVSFHGEDLRVRCDARGSSQYSALFAVGDAKHCAMWMTSASPFQLSISSRSGAEIGVDVAQLTNLQSRSYDVAQCEVLVIH